MVKLVVGLGNPGAQYESTRHNIGQMLFDYLSFAQQLRWQKNFKGLVASYDIQGEKIFFLKPQTYMNLSGESVLPLCQFYKIKVEEVLVLHDELDIPFGQIVLKRGGGLAGHNGLKSINQCLGNANFLRMRLGISRPTVGTVSNYVLSPFTTDEQISLEKYLSQAGLCVEFILTKGFDQAAGKWSRKNLIE